MQITALVENTSQDKKFGTEHGLSLYIEAGSQKILFDMGQSGLFADNAKVLGISLSDVTIAVLSHGHYDHGGGLAKFLEINKKAPVYISRYAFEGHYNGTEKYIGLNRNLRGNERLIYTDDIVSIGKDLMLYSCNKNPKKFHLGSFGLNAEVNGEMLPDDFRHEQYLLIEEDGKKVLTRVFWILLNGFSLMFWLVDSIFPNCRLMIRLLNMQNILINSILVFIHAIVLERLSMSLWKNIWSICFICLRGRVFQYNETHEYLNTL